MANRSAEAVWEGTLKEGKGSLKLSSGAFDGAYSFSSRFEEGTGTNPEELIAAAEAGCFTMALGAALERAGFPVERLHTDAKVHLERVNEQLSITRIDLVTEGRVPNLDDTQFQEQAQAAKQNCIISRALGGVEFNLTAKLV
ncbi:MAG: OsmC family protein [bacterium]|nr:OsmC family protein [bacterium]